MFKKQQDFLLLIIVILVLVYVYVKREHFTIENLTGNAPVELPLPKYLQKSEPTTLSEKDKARLDKRDIPTGYDEDTSYMLSPETVKGLLKDEESKDKSKDELEKKIMNDKITLLTKEIEELKKQQSNK
jgi:hypothetical protein